MTPERLGRFEIQELRGQGGMGSVYAARDSESGRRVALKVLSSSLLEDEEKFRRNYRIKSIVITVDDLQIEIPDQLDDNTDARRIQIGSLATTKVRIEVRSTYPAEQFNGGVPFDELALQSVRFFGTIAG